MASSDVSNVTKYFVTANEGFNTTLGSTISAGATSVGLNSTSGLTNGSVFVGIIEPGVTAQQVFTGTVDVSGSQITNVVWTRGNNVGHAAGVTIVDYSTGTARNMATTGILKQHTQAGLHTGVTTDTLSSTGNISVGGTLGVTGASTFTGAIGGAGYDAKTIANSYKFSVYASAGQSIGIGATAKIQLNAKEFDTGSNFDAVTNFRFTAPVAGFYFIHATVAIAPSGMNATGNGIGLLYKNGVEFKRGAAIKGTGDALSSITSQVTSLISLAANDFIELFGYNGDPSSARTTGGGANTTYLSGFLVSAT